MDKSILKNPIALVIIATVIALIPLIFDNENILVMLRLLSFGIYFYAIHLFFKKRKIAKKN
jgi:positive regulator of sigma E activity